jgi:hypothetical protein
MRLELFQPVTSCPCDIVACRFGYPGTRGDTPGAVRHERQAHWARAYFILHLLLSQLQRCRVFRPAHRCTLPELQRPWLARSGTFDRRREQVAVRRTNHCTSWPRRQPRRLTQPPRRGGRPLPVTSRVMSPLAARLAPRRTRRCWQRRNRFRS